MVDGKLFHQSARRFDAQRFDLERIAGDLRARHAFLLRVGITSASSENPAVPCCPTWCVGAPE